MSKYIRKTKTNTTHYGLFDSQGNIHVNDSKIA